MRARELFTDGLRSSCIKWRSGLVGSLFARGQCALLTLKATGVWTHFVRLPAASVGEISRDYSFLHHQR